MYTLFFSKQNRETKKWEVWMEKYHTIADMQAISGSLTLVSAGLASQADADRIARRKQRMLHA